MQSLFISPESIREAILQINKWPQNLPLILVFSKQNPGEQGTVSGGASAVRETYDSLFGLENFNISDDARKFYLHLCHGKGSNYPYAIKKQTLNYGKTHQRIIKDTFGQKFLTRIDEGKYQLNEDFSQKVLEYLKLDCKINLKPLVLETIYKVNL